jgi:hypothetical protein
MCPLGHQDSGVAAIPGLFHCWEPQALGLALCRRQNVGHPCIARITKNHQPGGRLEAFVIILV